MFSVCRCMSIQRQASRSAGAAFFDTFAAMGGAALATVGIAGRGMTEGDAVLAHSGGAFGALFGAMVEMGYRGDTSGSLKRGLGWGAAGGVLALGAVALEHRAPASPARIALAGPVGMDDDGLYLTTLRCAAGLAGSWPSRSRRAGR